VDSQWPARGHLGGSANALRARLLPQKGWPRRQVTGGTRRLSNYASGVSSAIDVWLTARPALKTRPAEVPLVCDLTT
jgi:hypothetical protein